MAIRKFRTGQMSYAVGTYVGTAGTLFYDEDTGALRISDGVTPGGSLIRYPIASSTEIGGIKLGPGIVLNGSGQIIIDSEGLDFSFGDLAATTETYPSDYFEVARRNQNYAVLSSITTNEDIVFASNGTGAVRVVGDFSVRRANGNLVGALEEQPIFRVRSDGQVRMLVPAADSAEGAFTIVGGLDAVFQAPVNTGVMLHITGIAGTPGIPSRLYNDAQNAFAAFVARRYNNTAAAPSAVLDGEEIMRLSGAAHNGTLIPNAANARIVYLARGNQTLTNQGGAIELWATPLNSITLAKVATVDSTGITLESGKVLTGNVTGNVSGTAGSIAAANITGTTLASNVVTSSLTTVGTLTNLSVTNTITGSVSGNAGTVTNGVYTTDTGTVTNTMLSGSIANNKLANSAVTVNGTSIALGASATVTAAAGTLTGTTLNATVVTSSLTSVGTLGSLTVTNLVSAKNYSGLARDAGTLGAAGTLTIDFATDHNVLINLTTTATIAFSNITAGKTITVLVKNATGNNRAVTLGVVAGNTSGGNSQPNVNDGRTGVLVYRTFGTATTDVYCEFN